MILGTVAAQLGTKTAQLGTVFLNAGGVIPPSTTGGASDKFTLGTKESLGVTNVPTIGGWWGW